MPLYAIRRCTRRFRKEEEGAVLIEAILWFPMFFSLFVLIADASVIFLNQARIKKIMQDGSRELAIGQIEDCDELEIWLEANIAAIAPSATASCSENYLSQPALSIATVSLDSGDLDMTGASGFLGGMTVNISMVYHLEVG